MYCSSCGSTVPARQGQCEVCGESQGLVPARSNGSAGPLAASPSRQAMELAACPRCGYRGEGIFYFSSGRHIAALIVAALLTSWVMGAGGLVYYLLRREHRMCPRCGQSWGHLGEYALHLGPEPEPARTANALSVPPESPRRGFSFLLFLLAAILIVGGIATVEMVPLAFGAAAAGGGFLLYQSAQREREERRRTIIAWLQLPVLQLAARRNGRLTVTDVSAHLGWPLPRAEKVLQSLDDGFRVSSEVTDEGLIVYEFRELLGPDRRLGGPVDESSDPN